MYLTLEYCKLIKSKYVHTAEANVGETGDR